MYCVFIVQKQLSIPCFTVYNLLPLFYVSDVIMLKFCRYHSYLRSHMNNLWFPPVSGRISRQCRN